ncbi:lipopolysaccharide assembly protein LapB [Aureispira sp. CCB-QB1]|uniref:tetratricopeptide repeat protein n=1 Tax=Aureispira sp. CCB-QB1 TaxID=1313421 RepID=UPI000696F67A|nr:tetratricopeptide repeat protein [Aureispira sp. CCB-QB1]
MIKNIILVLFCSISTNSYSQNLLDSLNNIACNCLSKITYDNKNLDRDSLTNQVNKCFKLKEVQYLYKKVMDKKKTSLIYDTNQEQKIIDYGLNITTELKKDCEAFNIISGFMNYPLNLPPVMEENDNCQKYFTGLYKLESSIAFLNDSILVEVNEIDQSIVYFKLNSQEVCIKVADYIKSVGTIPQFKEGDRMQLFITKIDSTTLNLECAYKGVIIPLDYKKINNIDDFHTFFLYLIKAEQYDLAKKIIKVLLLSDSNNPEYLFIMAKIDYEIDKYKAYKTIEEILSIESNLTSLGEKISTYYVVKKEKEKALEILDRLIELDNSKSSPKLLKGKLYFHLQEYRTSEKILHQILKQFPNLIDAYIFQALNYKFLKEGDKLVETCTKAISVDSSNSIPLDIISFHYLENNKPDSAIFFFNKIINLQPDDATIGRAYNNRAYAKYQLGEYDKAIDDIKESLAYFPNNCYTYKNLALIQIAQNKKETACINLNKALELGFTELYGDEVQILLKNNCK